MFLQATLAYTAQPLWISCFILRLFASETRYERLEFTALQNCAIVLQQYLDGQIGNGALLLIASVGWHGSDLQIQD